MNIEKQDTCWKDKEQVPKALIHSSSVHLFKAEKFTGFLQLQTLDIQIVIVPCKKSSYTKFTTPCCKWSLLLKKSVSPRSFTQQAT